MEPALERIRSGVKGNLDSKRLESGLAQLAEAVKTIEGGGAAPVSAGSAAGAAAPPPGDLLIAVLESLRFDESLRPGFLETIDYLSRFPHNREEIQSRVVDLLNASLARGGPVAAPVEAPAAIDSARLGKALEVLMRDASARWRRRRGSPGRGCRRRRRRRQPA